MNIRDVMCKKIVTLDGYVSVAKARAIMRKEKLECLPVFNGSHVVGIVSMRQLDALNALDSEVFVRDICDQLVIYASPESTTEEVLPIFTKMKVEALPVLNKFGHIVGTVTPMDFIRPRLKMVQQFEKPELRYA